MVTQTVKNYCCGISLKINERVHCSSFDTPRLKQLGFNQSTNQPINQPANEMRHHHKIWPRFLVITRGCTHYLDNEGMDTTEFVCEDCNTCLYMYWLFANAAVWFWNTYLGGPVLSFDGVNRDINDISFLLSE